VGVVECSEIEEVGECDGWDASARREVAMATEVGAALL
jgi:hypothetical protein